LGKTLKIIMTLPEKNTVKPLFFNDFFHPLLIVLCTGEKALVRMHNVWQALCIFNCGGYIYNAADV